MASWLDQYPAGIITVDANGNISQPSPVSIQTTDNVALTRLRSLIKSGSTSELTPLKIVNSNQVETFVTVRSLTLDWQNWLMLMALLLFIIWSLRKIK